MLLQSAKNYDRDKYTAVIWPDHVRGYNLGVVDSVTAQKNKDGGVDLYAVLEPNEFYRSNISYGQRMFASVELMPDFAKSGEWYLSGLAATDSPASLGAQEIKFSKLPDDKNLYSSFIEAEVDTSEDQATAFFKRLLHAFSKQNPTEDYDMTKEEADALKASVEELKTGFTALKPLIEKFTAGGGSENPPPPDAGDDAAKITELTTKLTAAENENATLKTTVAELTTKFTDMNSKMEAFGTKLAEALKEKPGTESEQHSSEKKLADFA